MWISENPFQQKIEIRVELMEKTNQFIIISQINMSRIAK